MPQDQKDDSSPMDRFMDRLRGGAGGDGGGKNPNPEQRKVHFSLWYFLFAMLLISFAAL